MLCLHSHFAILSRARSASVGIWYSVVVLYMMCPVVIVVVIVIAVVAAAAQPIWKPAELNVGPSVSLTSDTAWLLSHIKDLSSGGRRASLIRTKKRKPSRPSVQLLTIRAVSKDSTAATI